MSKLLTLRESRDILQQIAEHAPDYSHLEEVRFIGKCDSCGDDTLFCCYKAFSGGMSCSDHFLHFCTNCHNKKFDSVQQQEDLENGLEAAICPYCGYNWSDAYLEREKT